MIVEPTTDYGAVKKILTSPGIWEEIGGVDPNTFEVPSEPVYLMGTVDIPMGLFILHGDPEAMECHVQVLPEYREEYSMEFGQKVVEMSKDYTKKLTAEIPKRFENVHRFALANGFEVTSEDEDNRFYERVL